MQALAYPAQELQMEKSNSTSAEGFCLRRSLAIGILGQGRMGLSPQQPIWKVCKQDCTTCRFLLGWEIVFWKKVCCSLSPRGSKSPNRRLLIYATKGIQEASRSGCRAAKLPTAMLGRGQRALKQSLRIFRTLSQAATK